VAALSIELTPAELEEISAATPPGAAAGMRYLEAGMQSVNRRAGAATSPNCVLPTA